MKLPVRQQMQPACGRPARGGFTLLEILLVVAVMAAIAGLAWPALMRSLTDHHLKTAAQQVREELAATRSRAIDAGLIYQFLYEPGGRRFVSIPYERETAPSDNQRLRITSSVAIDDLPRRAGEIPEGLVFPKAAPIDFDARQLPSELFAGLPEADSLVAVGWSDPVLFHTDGSAEGPDMVLADPAKQLAIAVSVRRLTGSVTVGPVEREATP